MDFVFRVILFILFWCLFISYSSTSQIIVQKTCTLQKKYPTLIPQTYTAYHLTTYVTVEYVFCWFFPTFKCPRKVENTRTTSSLRTRLIESTVTRTISVCCPGYEEVPNRENYCTPICEEECENGGICYKPGECICKPQYTGVACGEDVDECSSSGICQHSCVNYFGYHQCTCSDGFYLHTDESSCNEYSLQINSFRATLKSTDSVSLDWQLESEPYLQDISGLIESISIDRTSETSSLLHLPADSRSALFFNLLPNVDYTYELNIQTIHGHLITSRISVTTPPDGIECPVYYNAYQTNPCGEGSICRDSADNLNYTCECLPGYSEPDCENINECSEDPCQNGALCVDGINEYTCICASQRFTGENCEIQQSLCDLDESPCNGHGTCISGAADYTCDCDVGYRGLHCDEEIDFCSSNPCQHGATCMNGAASAVCECTTNYNGDFCEYVINPCIGHSCNGGQCFVTQDREAICNCTDHLTGDRCSITCTDENGDLCVCNTTTQDGACQGYCLDDRDDFYDISWNRTIRGSVANVPCSLISSTLTGFVTRSCLSTSRWSDVNITECTDIPDTEITDTFSNCTTARTVAGDLLAYTELSHLPSADNTDINALFTILKDLAIYSNQHACSRYLDKVIIDVISGLLNVDYFSGLHIDTQAEFRNSLRTIEDMMSLLSPTDDVSLSETGISTFLRNDTDIDYLRVQLPTPTTEVRKYEIQFVSGEFSDVSVSIPSQILQDKGVTPQLDVVIIQSSEVFNSLNTTVKNEGELISQIISLNIRNKDQTFSELQVPIQITFEIKENNLESISCVYLNELGKWSTEGVTLETMNNIKVTCIASHLSMFAVIGRYNKPVVTSIIHATIETPVNTTQQNGYSVINLLTLISSIFITTLIAVFLIIVCIARFYTDTKGIGDTLDTVCMFNTSSAHLLMSLLIGLTVIIQLTQLSEPTLCFASRAITQYSYLVLISSIITELIIGLIYLNYVDKDGQLRKVKWILALSLILCWATPAVITLFTTIPLYKSVSILQTDSTLRCAFLATDGTFYTITAYFFVSFVVFTSFSLIAIVYMKKTAIAKQKIKFLMKFMPRSVLLMTTHLVLFVTIIPAVFLLPKEVKSHIFYLHQLIAILVLLLLMCYLQRGTFKRCFRVNKESTEVDVETTTTATTKETDEKRITDNELKLTPFPFNSNYPTAMTGIGSMGDIFLSPVLVPKHSRSQSESVVLEDDSTSERQSIQTNPPLYHIHEHSGVQDSYAFSPNPLLPFYHGGGQSLPRYLIPCALPFESAAHDTPQTDPRFYIHPDVPLQMIHGSSPRKSMTDATKIKSLRGNNAVSCELLDTPDLTRRRIPMFFVERKLCTKRKSNSLPFLNVVAIDD